LQRASGLLARAVGRPLARPSAAAARDAVQRARHAITHRRAPAGADVFNLDLHVAVVGDARTQLERRGLLLDDWTVSGHSWTIGRSRDPVAIVNERTWHAFGPRLVRRFRAVYGSYLAGFRGYLATYPPCFALLYEDLGPTLAVAATRYEWPFTHHAGGWEWLDDGLRRGVDKGWLTLIANNRADADYIENYTGLRPAHVPSACAYVKEEYTGRTPAAVISTNDDELARSIGNELRHDTVPLRGGLGRHYSQADLYDYRALVFIPYNVSLMTLFENYTACAPIYVPERDFLKRLAVEHPTAVLSSLSFTQVTGRPPAPHAIGRDLNDVRDGEVIDWYLDRADFYDETWMPHIRRFESWSHLDHLLATDDPRETNERMRADRDERLRRIAALWDELDWMRTLAG
jgi:hypothetical protein